MALTEAIRTLVETKGLSILSSPMAINILSDYNAFSEHPSSKNILKNIISEGYLEKIAFFYDNKLPIGSAPQKYLTEFYGKLGLRQDVAAYVLSSILEALGFEGAEITVPAEPALPSAVAPVGASGEHIVFSGISLAHSLTEIEKHLQGRGFKTVGKKGFQIEMSGPFCGFTEHPKLYINGSPLGVTKNIVLIFNPKSHSTLLEICCKLHHLLEEKYGQPKEKDDIRNIVYKDFDYYIANITWFSEKVENYDTICDYVWQTNGGSVWLNWVNERVLLSYTDTLNTEAAEEHQKKFDQESI